MIDSVKTKIPDGRDFFINEGKDEPKNILDNKSLFDNLKGNYDVSGTKYVNLFESLQNKNLKYFFE